jgi:hypothetical protein
MPTRPRSVFKGKSRETAKLYHPPLPLLFGRRGPGAQDGHDDPAAGKVIVIFNLFFSSNISKKEGMSGYEYIVNIARDLEPDTDREAFAKE